jgi:hypothetical protein
VAANTGIVDNLHRGPEPARGAGAAEAIGARLGEAPRSGNGKEHGDYRKRLAENFVHIKTIGFAAVRSRLISTADRRAASFIGSLARRLISVPMLVGV